jgi:hypothetical protein
MLTEMKTISGKTFAISVRPFPLYEIGSYVPPGMRLLRSYEVQRMKVDGFPWGELEIEGKFWTATRVSCSLNCSWNISGNDAEMVLGGWDKTFLAWGVFIMQG